MLCVRKQWTRKVELGPKDRICGHLRLAQLVAWRAERARSVQDRCIREYTARCSRAGKPTSSSSLSPPFCFLSKWPLLLTPDRMRFARLSHIRAVLGCPPQDNTVPVSVQTVVEDEDYLILDLVLNWVSRCYGGAHGGWLLGGPESYRSNLLALSEARPLFFVYDFCINARADCPPRSPTECSSPSSTASRTRMPLPTMTQVVATRDGPTTVARRT